MQRDRSMHSKKEAGRPCPVAHRLQRKRSMTRYSSLFKSIPACIADDASDVTSHSNGLVKFPSYHRIGQMAIHANDP